MASTNMTSHDEGNHDSEAEIVSIDIQTSPLSSDDIPDNSQDKSGPHLSQPKNTVIASEEGKPTSPKTETETNHSKQTNELVSKLCGVYYSTFIPSPVGKQPGKCKTTTTGVPSTLLQSSLADAFGADVPASTRKYCLSYFKLQPKCSIIRASVQPENVPGNLKLESMITQMKKSPRFFLFNMIPDPNGFGGNARPEVR
eukprot:40687_1